jgi:predicted 3-demethylubiquinone-9 3-methyltransferase (glyoxalase superfamily)
MIVEFSLSGVPFATLNGGPYFKIDPSISFFVNCTSKEELQTLWDTLVDGGEVLMPLDTYPWSEKYGWLSDKFGVNWQLFHTPDYVAQKITPCLTFTKERAGMAEEAMKHYTEIFAQSGIDMVARYEAGEGDVE